MNPKMAKNKNAEALLNEIKEMQQRQTEIKQEATTGSPAIMSILGIVARSAGVTISHLLGSTRSEALTIARAVFYQIAGECGFDRSEIMYYICRHRTVRYNLESNIDGHLRKNKDFIRLYKEAKSKVERLKKSNKAEQKREREELKLAEEMPQDTKQESRPDRATPQMIDEPKFTDWKGKLGWTFTAEECRRAYYTILSANLFMQAYGKPHTPPQELAPRDEQLQR